MFCHPPYDVGVDVSLTAMSCYYYKDRAIPLKTYNKFQVTPWIRPTLGSARVSNAAGDISRSNTAQPSHLSSTVTVTVWPPAKGLGLQFGVYIIK